MKIITNKDGITNKSFFILVAVCSGLAMAVMTAISLFAMFPEALQKEEFWFAPLMIILIPLFNSIFLAGITCLTFMMLKKTKMFEFINE